MKKISLGLFLTGCTSPDKNIEEDNVVDIGATIEEAFRVPERPWDLALHPDGRIFCSAQAGSKLYAWDPTTESREEMTASFNDIQALQFTSDDEIFYTTTEYGVTGSLSKMVGSQSEVLHTESDDGILFRWPADLIPSPEGGWVLADYEAAGLFVISPNGSVEFQQSGSSTPEALAFHEAYLYIGGEDGVFRKEWPDGAVEKIESRAALSLEVVENELWAGNSEQGIYIVDGASLGFDQAARVGSMLWTGEVLYFSDTVGEGVWKATW